MTRRSESRPTPASIRGCRITHCVTTDAITILRYKYRDLPNSNGCSSIKRHTSESPIATGAAYPISYAQNFSDHLPVQGCQCCPGARVGLILYLTRMP